MPVTDPPDGVSGRMTARGPIVAEHEFRFYGDPDPALARDGKPGVRVECTCGAVHRVEGGHTMSQFIRLTCNEVGIT